MSWMAEVPKEMLTLSVQEVVNQHIVTAVGLERSVLEVLVGVGAIAHVLLSKALDMLFDVVSVLLSG